MEKITKAKLLETAKQLGIVGRHRMTKEQLHGEVKRLKQKDGKKRYLDSLNKGILVAFKKEGKVLSGKVDKVMEESVELTTRLGSMYAIKKCDILWVKTGERWPRNIYNLLRGIKNGY